MSWRSTVWQNAELRALALLKRGPLVRRSRGWRFGTARIDSAAVERLVTTGKAFIRGDEVWLSTVQQDGAATMK